jgi:hypothetical protein
MICSFEGFDGGIGNGERVSIMKDNWIPGFPTNSFKPLSRIPRSAKVQFLMNDEDTDWEEQTIHAFFQEELANTVLQIPISRHGGEDFVSWVHDKHGQYTVRSAYNMARTTIFFSDMARRDASSGREDEESLWKFLWVIQASGKIKMRSSMQYMTACQLVLNWYINIFQMMIDVYFVDKMREWSIYF